MEWFEDIALPPLSMSPEPMKQPSSGPILDDMDNALNASVDTFFSLLTDEPPPTSAQPKSKEGLLSSCVVFPKITIDDFCALWKEGSWDHSNPSPAPTDTVEPTSNDTTTSGLLDSQKRLQGFTITTRPRSLNYKKRLYNYTDDATGRTYTSLKLATAARKRSKK
jgi:hypothetical protein